jgi:hypothetical protein
MIFKRMPLPPSVSRATRGERDGGPPIWPDDVVMSSGDNLEARPIVVTARWVPSTAHKYYDLVLGPLGKAL